ncbi:MAG: N-acetylgalactosamine-6-sulfatase [Acinetobacter sp.]|nr:MAG: N-acetylgalactosamine-6-sulfatase [Acinetobacter sp.]
MLNKLMATSLLILCSISLCCAQKQSKPNIVFILADDLGYGDLSAYGQKKFSTPNIDRLAAKGIKFTQFYAGTSVCAPSRSSLLSGQHTGHTYVRGNKEVQPEGQQPIPDSVGTIAEQFKKAGYATAIFGKWGLGFVGTSGDPNNQGFETFYGYNCQRESHRFYPSHLWENDKKVLLKGNDELQHHETYAPDLIQGKALSFLDKNKDKPFFLYLTYTFAFFNSAGGLRGVKRDLYEGGIRVPFIVNWPQKIKSPSLNNHIGAFWDLYPTFSQLLGVKQNSYTDGVSILPSILGERGQKQHDYLYWEFHENNGRQAVRRNNWKGVYLNVKTKNAKFELYDLAKDPQERNDVALNYPKISMEIRDIMKRAHEESNVYPLLINSK